MHSSTQQQNVVVPSQPTGVQVVNPCQQQIAIVTQQAFAASTPNYDPLKKHRKALLGLGITECALGGLSIVLAVATICIVPQELAHYWHWNGGGYSDNYHHFFNPATSYRAQGIWCGIVVIVTGCLGIRVKAKPSRSMYIANMTMAIITGCISFAGLVLSGVAANISYHSNSLVILHSIIALLCLVSVALSAVHATVCCGGVCKKTKYVATQQVIYQPQQNIAQLQPQYVQGPNGQLMMVVNQPIPLPQYTPQAMTIQQGPAIIHPTHAQVPVPNDQEPGQAQGNMPEKEPPV